VSRVKQFVPLRLGLRIVRLPTQAFPVVALDAQLGDWHRFAPVVERDADDLRVRRDTAGCTYAQIFATPGWRIRSRWYSRQYEVPVAGGVVLVEDRTRAVMLEVPTS
jgi:hypothetical protein